MLKPRFVMTLVFASCAHPAVPVPDDKPTELPSPPVAANCVEGATWTAGNAVFVDRTAASGLEEMGVEAQHFASIDYNGDGWPDLVARRDQTKELDWDDWASGDRSFWLLENQRDGTWADRTRESGIVASRISDDRGRPAEIAIFGDVDNDGDLDAFTAFRNNGELQEGAELMLNDGRGRFVAGKPGRSIRNVGEPWPAYGASFVDHDRDGRLDLWVAYFGAFGLAQRDVLWEQLDNGVFADRSAAVGIINVPTADGYANGQGPTFGWGTTVCDLNGDGAPELMATSYARAPNHLWLGGSRYKSIAASSGYAFDEDLEWSDNESARCWCTLHPDDEGCAGVPPPEVFPCKEDRDARRWTHQLDRHAFKLGGNSATTVCVDVDGDGDLDLLNTELRHWDVGESSDRTELLINDGGDAPVFSRPGREATGLTRVHTTDRWDEGDLDAAALDFDNDGHSDLWINSSDYPGTRAHLYHHIGPARFAELGVADFVELTRAKGIAVADFDRDGDLDVIASRSPIRCEDGPDCVGFHARYFENVVGNKNNWVQLSLRGGEGTNRAAIGARVAVDNGEHTQIQEVGGGYGRLGIQHDLTLHFGLGVACEATVTVRWPDADLTMQTFKVVAGYRWRIEQGDEPRPLER